MSAVETVLFRLPAYVARDGYWTARCPAHDDKHASLSIREGQDGTALLKCHAGCEYEDIMLALGLEPKDGFESSPNEPEATYNYVDEQGNLLYQVVRLPGKQFRQRQPHRETGEWIWSMKDARRVLYNLPLLIEAVGKRIIFIVEGEKDADAIVKAGGVATTSVGGAGKWQDSYSETLRGAHVMIVADKDEPGQKHAEQIRASLEGIAASVKIVQAAVGKDAHDHLKAGYALEDFEPMLPATGLVVTPAVEVKPRSIEWVNGFEDMLGYGLMSSLWGMPGVNKSTFACLVGAHVSRAGKGVLYMTAEDLTFALRGRLQAAGADLRHCNFGEMRRDGVDGGIVLVPQDIPELERTVERKGIKYLVIDPIQAHFGPGIESNADNSVRTALSPLGKMAERHDLCVLLIAHLNKGNSTDPMIRAGGSIGIPGISRTALLMAPHPEHGEWDRVILGFKNSYGPLADAVQYQLEVVQVESDYSIRLSPIGKVDYNPHQLLKRRREEDA